MKQIFTLFLAREQFKIKWSIFLLLKSNRDSQVVDRKVAILTNTLVLVFIGTICNAFILSLLKECYI